MHFDQSRRIICTKFPGLLFSEFEVTSPRTNAYNCIAWAAGETHVWWWPAGRYWPGGVPHVDTVEAFRDAFQTKGYTPCETGSLEEGFEKVALYTGVDGRVTHAARQLQCGKWTSKLGGEWDITHELKGLEGDEYGRVVCYLKRRTAANP